MRRSYRTQVDELTLWQRPRAASAAPTFPAERGASGTRRRRPDNLLNQVAVILLRRAPLFFGPPGQRGNGVNSAKVTLAGRGPQRVRCSQGPALQGRAAGADNRECAHSNGTNTGTLERHEHHRGHSMKTVALVSMKGGSGKTTVAAHVAAAAAAQGRNVALLDTDPQQSAARWGDRRAAALPVVLTVPPSRLAAELQRCADAGTDLAIIDTPPRAGSDNAAQVAARVADLVLLPCRPSVLDVEAAADTAARVLAVTSAPVVALLTACAPRGQDADQIAAALAGVDVQVAPVRLGHRIVFARSLLAGQVAQEAEPDGRAAQEVAAVLAFIACTLERREHSNTSRGAA